jgi:hypothetical protein
MPTTTTARKPKPAPRRSLPAPEPEITGPVMLCDERGRLNPDAIGWSPQPLHTCNVTGHAPRKKKWTYWAINTDKVLFSVMIADVDHYVLAVAYFLEFDTERFVERVAILAPGAMTLPETVRSNMVFEAAGVRVAFENDRRGTRIGVRWPDFLDGPLVADLLVEQPRDHETLNVVIPWSRDRFQFTSKQNTLRVSGTIALGDEKIRLKRTEAFACQDFGRGVWKNRTAWNWGASSSVLPDGRTLGFNLGGKWTDGTGMTENGICVDGRLSKLSEDLAFVYDEANFMKPWRIRAKSKRIDLRFVPFYERVSKAKAGVLHSEVHQMFGHYSGAVTPDDGKPIAVDKAFGWIEEHKARW